MKDLLLFDVDGTLAESSQMINDKMRDMLITKSLKDMTLELLVEEK